ncbi:tape measure protein [Thermomonas sp.]|uniref:tape measure protein n=1 Tax=Thermomonas sp. TaxID=1971895 RepID=UPI003D09B7FE
MASNPNLRVKISADLADIKQGLGLLRGELAKVKQQSAQAFSGNSSNALVDSLRRARAELAAFVGAYASLAGAKLLAGVADEATRVRGRIREAKGDYEAILVLSQRTRTDLTSTVDIYTRLERSTRGRIKDNQQLLNLTEAINQAVKLSFTSQAAGDAALTQLGQALASGVLRGEELNSVMEQTPRLAQAIADGLNVPIGQLRALAKEGKLTTDVVIKALQSQATVLSDEYARMPLTIRDAFTQIRNSFVDYVGKADAATGASRAFAQALQDIAKNLPRYLDPLLTAVKLLLQNLDALAVLVGTRLALAAVPAMITAVTALRNAFVTLRTATIAWSTVAAALGGPVGLALAAIATVLYLAYQRTNQLRQAEEQHRKVMEEIEGQAQKNIVSGYQLAEARRQEARDALEAAKAQLQLARARFAAENTSVTARGGDRGDAAALGSTRNLNQRRDLVSQLEKQEAELTAKLRELESRVGLSYSPTTGDATTGETDTGKAIAKSNALQQDAVKRAIAEVERLYKASEIGTREYFATLTQLQQQAIDLQIQQARNELAVTKDKGQRLKLEEEITILQRDRADVAKKNALDEQQAQDAMIDKLGEVRAQLADLDGDAGRAARIRIETQYLELFKQLEADSNETGKAMVRNLVDRLVDKAKLDAVRSRVGEVTSALSSREQSISTQIDAGTLGYGEGERQLQDIRQRSLDQLRELRAQLQAYLQTMAAGSPEQLAAQQGLDELDASIASITAAQDKFRMQLEDQATNALGSFFNDLIDGAKSFKEAFTDMVRSFLSGIAKMIAQELALRAVRSLFSLFGGGPTANAKGNAFNAGGLQAFARGAVFPTIAAFAAGGAFTNQVVASPTLFAFANGGQLGLMGEAGPEAIMPLQRGPDGKLGVRNNGGDRPAAGYRIVNVFDPSFVPDQMDSAAGEKVILNVIGRNPGRVKQLIG